MTDTTPPPLTLTASTPSTRGGKLQEVFYRAWLAEGGTQDESDTTPSPLPPGYIDPEHQGEDRELLEAFYGACKAEGGTSDEIHLRGIRAVLAHRPSVAAVRAADAAISDEALEAELRAWWKAKVHPLNVPAYHTITTHVAWAQHILKRGQA